MKLDPKASPQREPDETRASRLIRPRSLDGAAFPGWGPKLG